jgi:hypothetical protein
MAKMGGVRQLREDIPAARWRRLRYAIVFPLAESDCFPLGSDTQERENRAAVTAGTVPKEQPPR